MSTIQSNHSLQFVTPVINRFVDDLFVNIPPAGARSVFEIVHAGNQSAMLCCRAIIQRNQLGSCPGCWGHTDGLMNFNKTFFPCERHSSFKQFAPL